MSEKGSVGVALGFSAVMAGLFAYVAVQEKPHLKVTELWTYPIKSCAPVRLQQARLDDYGFQHDRRWVVVEQESGEMAHQRKYKSMATVKTEFAGNELRISAPGMDEVLAVKLFDENDEGKPRRKVIIFGQELVGIDEGEAAAKWFSDFLGIPCALCKRPPSGYERGLPDTSVEVLDSGVSEVPGIVAYTDEHPLLVCTTASLRDLNGKLAKVGKKEVPISRFRPNIVVDEECGVFSAGKRYKGFIEHDWRKITIGAVTLLSTGHKNRCVMTTVDQATGTTEPRHLDAPAPGEKAPLAATNKDYYEPVTTLRGYRLDESANSPVFGESFSHTKASIGSGIKVGDYLTAVTYKPAPVLKASSS